MKKQKRTYPYDGIYFPSVEERDFYYWCEEAVRNDVLLTFVHQPDPFIITPKYTEIVCKKEKHLLHPWTYQPDYVIYSKIGNINGLRCSISGYIYYIDTKGFGATHDSKALFSLKQKGLYHVHGIYVNKVVPKTFFKKTWVPEKARFTPTGKPRKHFYDMKTYMESNKYGRL